MFGTNLPTSTNIIMFNNSSKGNPLVAMNYSPILSCGHEVQYAPVVRKGSIFVWLQGAAPHCLLAMLPLIWQIIKLLGLALIISVSEMADKWLTVVLHLNLNIAPCTWKMIMLWGRAIRWTAVNSDVGHLGSHTLFCLCWQYQLTFLVLNCFHL